MLCVCTGRYTHTHTASVQPQRRKKELETNNNNKKREKRIEESPWKEKGELLPQFPGHLDRDGVYCTIHTPHPSAHPASYLLPPYKTVRCTWKRRVSKSLGLANPDLIVSFRVLSFRLDKKIKKVPFMIHPGDGRKSATTTNGNNDVLVKR